MRYIFELYLYTSSNFEFKDSTFYTLCQFSKDRELSIYQICSQLKTTDYRVEYKNVHKRIQKFHSVKLLKKTTTRDLKHASIYYKLTDVGVFCILDFLYQYRSLFSQEELIEVIKGIINNYGDNDFFHIFIYPFFDKSTILNLKSKVIIDDFLNFCRACSEQGI